MATPLVYLDVDDEITSAASRIRSAEGDRLALVLPYGSRLATSRINFRLLAREAVERGKQLEIVTNDSSARALAAAAGLPVHPSVAAFEGATAGVGNGTGVGGNGSGATAGDGAAAQLDAVRGGNAGHSAAAGGPVTVIVPAGDVAALDETQTRVITAPRDGAGRVPRVGPARPPIRTGVAVAFGIGLLALVVVAGLLAFTLLPSATIVLNPRSQSLGPIALTVEAHEGATADPGGLVIPAQQFTFQLEAHQTFSATGTKVTMTKATGNVTFSNFDTGGSNRIAAGAVVRTPAGIEFETLADVTLPAATIQFPFTIIPSTATVGVQAVAEGEEGNVGNNSITVVPKGENRRLLQVTNKEATSGGGRQETPQVTQADVDAAILALDAALKDQLDQQVQDRTGVPVGITLFPQTSALGDRLASVDPSTLVNTEVATFELGETGQGTAIGVDPSPIDALAEAQLEKKVTAGWRLDPSSVATSIGTPGVLDGVISYPVSVRGTQVHAVDKAALVGQIKGLGLAAARSTLETFGDVQITLWPDWVTSIPSNPDRITVTIGEPRPAASPAP